MSIGETLAAARRERGMDVEDVSRSTRVRAALIRSIEADDFAATGPSVYTRGHIRSIAAALGLDPAPLLQEYDATFGGADAAPAAVQVRDPDTVRADPSNPNWLAAAVVAMLVVVVLLAVGVITGGDERLDTASGNGEETSEATAEPADEPGPQAAPPPPPPPPPPAPEGVSVRVAVENDRSWLRVTDADDSTLFEGMLEEGAVQEFTDEYGLDLTVGDAGAVTLVVNGQDLGSPGPSGEVARLSYAIDEPVGDD